MNLITTSAVLGFFIVVVVCSVTSSQVFLKRYRNCSVEHLVRSNRIASKFARVSLVSIVAGPILMGAIVSNLTGFAQRMLISFFIILLMCTAAMFWAFRRVEQRTSEEIALRKLRRHS